MPRRYRTQPTAPQINYEDPRTAYVNETNPEALYSNPHFISDLRSYYEERGLRGASTMRGEGLVRQFLRDGVWRNVNTISAIGSAFEATSSDPESQARQARIEQASRNIPNFWQEGGRGWDAAGDIAGAAIFDPVNLLGGLAAKGVSQVATRGLTRAGMRGSTALGAGAGIGAAAATEGAISAGQEAVVDTALQHRDISLGLQDRFDGDRLRNATLMGGALGAGLGGLIGAPGAVIGAGSGRRQGQALRQADELARALPEEGLIDGGDIDPIVAAETVADDVSTTSAQLAARQDQLAERAAEQEAAGLDASETQQEEHRTALLQAASTSLQARAQDIQARQADGALDEAEARRLLGEVRALAGQVDEAISRRGADDLDEVAALAARIEGTDTPAPNVPTEEQVDQVLDRLPEQQVEPEAPATPDAESTAIEGAPAGEAPTEPSGPSALRQIGDWVRNRATALRQLTEAGARAPILDDAANVVRSALDSLNRMAEQTVAGSSLDGADAQLLARLQDSPPLPTTDEIADLIPNIVAPDATQTRITPGARALATVYDIDTRLIEGSGPNQLVTVQDVHRVRQEGAVAPRRAGAFRFDDIDLPSAQRIWESEDAAGATARSEYEAILRQIGHDNALTQRELAELVHTLGASDAYSTDAATLASFVRLADFADANRAANPDPSFIGPSQAGRPDAENAPVRGADAGERIDARLTIDPDRASLYNVPGMDATQSILRRGRAISKGSSYTLTDGKAPTKSSLGFEAAKARAEEDGSIQPHAHSGYGRVFGEGAKDVKAGDLVYYNPQTNKVYTSRLAANKASGQEVLPAITPEARTAELRAVVQMSDRQTSTLLDNLERLRQGRRPLRAVKAVPTPPSPEVLAKQEAIIVPVGHVPLAARIKKNKKDNYRVASRSQTDNGAQVSDLLGREDPENWEIITAPAELVEDARLRHGSDYREIFEEVKEREAIGDFSVSTDDMDLDEGVIDLGAKSPDRNRTIKPLSAMEAEALSLAADVTGLSTKHPKLYGAFAEGSEPKLRELAYLEAALSRASWAKITGENLGPEAGKRLATTARTLAEMIGREAPEGIVNGNVAREVALADFERIMSHLSPEEMNEALRFLSGVAGDDRGRLPRFERTTKADGTSAHGVTPHGTQYIRLKSAEGSLPHLHQFYHEMAHWAYHNMISPAEKARFWGGMQKYIDGLDGREGGVELHEALPVHNALLARKVDGQVQLGVTNADVSPDELFAEQFVLYMTREQHSSLLAQPGYWERFTQFIRRVVDRFLGKAPDAPNVDADLIPIFDRILPDSHRSRAETDIPESLRVLPRIKEPEYSSDPKVARRQRRNFAATGRITGILVDMDTIQDRIERAITVNDTEGVVEGFRDLAEFYQRNRNAGYLSAHRAEMEKRLGKINELLAIEAEDAGLAGLSYAEISARDTALERLDSEGLIEARHSSRKRVANELAHLYWFGDGTALTSPSGRSVQGIHGQLDYMRGKVLLPRYAELTGGRPRVIRRARPSMIMGKAYDPASDEAIALVATESLMAQQLKRRRRTDLINTVLVEQADAVAARQYEENAPRPRRLSRTVSDFRSLQSEDLLEYFRETRNTNIGIDVAAEIVRRKNTALPIFPSSAVVPADKSIPRAELSRLVAAGIADGNPAMVERYGAEYQRRLVALKGEGALHGEGIVRPKHTEWEINQEWEDFAEATPDAVPTKARPIVRAVTTGMTHRNKDTQRALRKLAYRLLNQMRKTERPTNGSPNLLADHEVARIADLDPATAGGDDAVDFRKPAYNRLRTILRGIALGMTNETVDPLKSVSSLTGLLIRSDAIPGLDTQGMRAIYASLDDDARAAIIKAYGVPYESMGSVTQAERATAAYMADQLSNYMAGNLPRKRLLSALGELDSDATAALMSGIGQLPERMANLLNGMGVSQRFRKEFRTLGVYGDMFRPTTAKLEANDAPSPASAARDASDYIRKLTPRRRKQLNNVLKGTFGLTDNGDIRVFYVPATETLRGSKNNKIPVEPIDGPNGNGFYIEASPLAAASEVEGLIRSGDVKGTLKALGRKLSAKEIEDLGNHVVVVRSARAELQSLRVKRLQAGEQLSTADAADPVGSEQDIASLDASIDMVRRTEEEILGRISKALDADAVGVIPVVTSVKNVLDLTPSARHSLADENLDALVQRAAEIADLDAGKAAEQFALLRSLGDEVSGDRLREGIVDALARSGQDYVQDRQSLYAALSQAAAEAKYEAIQFTTRVPGESDSRTSLMILGNSGVQRLTAKALIEPDDLLPRGEIPGEVRGSVVNSLAEGEVATAKDLPHTTIEEALESQSVDPAIGRTLSSMAKERPHTPDEVETLSKLSKLMPDFLSEQSTRLRERGFNWYADWFKDTFTRRQNAFGRKFLPLRSVMDALTPDNSGFRRWKRGVTMGKLGNQPPEHRRVLAALRYGPGSPAHKALSPKELDAYTAIRKAFDNELDELRNAGVFVGRRLNYVPQVWNPEAMRKNADEVKELLATYYQRERSAKGEELAPHDEAQAFADRVFNRLTDENANGLLLDPMEPTINRRTTGAKEDALDFSRVLELERHPDMLKAFEPYLESDLETLLVKYFDGSTRRLENVRTLGVNNHAFYDYMTVARDGAEGVASLLSTNRVFKRGISGTFGGEDTYIDIPNDMGVPFAGNKEAAAAFARRVVAAYQANPRDTDAIREMLTTAHGSFNASQHYNRRVDAIIAGLQDMDSVRTEGAKREDSFGFADKTLRLAMHQPLDDHQHNLRKVSSFARAFNSVTLLGFTTLSSLGDVALPLVRSGNLKAFRDGVAKSLDNSPEGKAYRQFLYNSGVAIENVLHERMMHLYGTDAGKGQIAFFNATMLTPWTDTMRRMTAAVGFESFHAMQRIANDTFNPARPVTEQSAAYRRAHRFLHRYGLQDFLPGGPRNNVSLENWRVVDKDPVMGPKLGAAIVKFADETVFQPNPNDLPMWSQTPIGQMAFQLKSFQLMASRLTGYMADEAMKQNYRPLAYMATVGGAFGAGVLGIKDIVQSRGGEDNRSPELRRRNLLQAFGFDEEVHGNADNYLGWHLEGLGQIAGAGLLIDTIYGVVDQAENGAYGKTRIVSMIGGPTAGALMDSIDVVGGGLDALHDNFRENPTNSKERIAARAVAQRIPVLGGHRGAREGIADAVAGPRGGREEQASPFGGGFSAGGFSAGGFGSGFGGDDG